MLHDLRGYEFERKALRANNLRPKEKQLNVVFATVDTAEQGVGRAECIEAKADDYANGAVGREETSRLYQDKHTPCGHPPLHNVIVLLFLWMDLIFAFAVKRLEIF